jgi:hypothetical protein
MLAKLLIIGLLKHHLVAFSEVTLDTLLQSNGVSALRSKSRRLARSKTRGTAVLLGNATLNQWDCLSSRADTFSSKTGEPAGLLLLAACFVARTE